MKSQLHGLRHKQSLVISSYSTGERLDIEYKVDTKSDPEWVVVKDPFGDPVGRQAKQSSGRVFAQSMSNPDYEGRESYACEYYVDGCRGWERWDSHAPKGELVRMLRRTLA